MGMIEDILKALDRIPIWKRLSGLPAEHDELKARLDALEKKLAGEAAGDECPICKQRQFIRISTGQHPQFGFAGVMLDVFKCGACGHKGEQTRDTLKR